MRGSRITRRSNMTFFAGIGVIGMALGLSLFPSFVISFIVTSPITQDNGFSFERGTLPPASSSRSPHRHGDSKNEFTSTSLPMVFDFFKDRASEGVEQLGKFSDLAKRGNLGDALKDVASYTKETNKAFASGLAKSRTRLLYDIDNMVNNKGNDYLEDLEMLLLQSDLGISTTDEILDEVKSFRYEGSKFLSKKDLLATIRGKLLEALNVSVEVPESSITPLTRQVRFANPDATDANQRLTVLFLMGANGMGKTTTIGKLAHRLRTEGDQKVLLAACDTFRAGAVEQLEQWGTRAEVEVFTPSESVKSPSAVLYGALDKALKEKYHTLLVDTSGRLSNNDALTRELVKMKGVIQKRLSLENKTVENPDGTFSALSKPNAGVPHETLLVIDAAQGRMALDSARQWNEDVGLTGLILTKLDGSARGGSVVAVSRELKLPVKLVGVGESIDALKDFEPEPFVDGLLGIGAAGGTGGKVTDGKDLDDRLKELRKNRDARANTMPLPESTQSATPDLRSLANIDPVSAEQNKIQTPDWARMAAGNAGRKKKNRGKKKNRTKG